MIEENPAIPVRTGKRVMEASQSISEPLEQLVCKSTVNKRKRKDIAKDNKIKTSQNYPQKTKPRAEPEN